MYFDSTLSIENICVSEDINKIGLLKKYRRFLNECKNNVIKSAGYEDIGDYLCADDIEPDLIVFIDTIRSLEEMLKDILNGMQGELGYQDVDYHTFKEYLIEFLIREGVNINLKGEFIEGVCGGGCENTSEYYSFEYITVKRVSFELDKGRYIEKLVYPTL